MQVGVMDMPRKPFSFPDLKGYFAKFPTEIDAYSDGFIVACTDYSRPSSIGEEHGGF
jgi:hypothetical protein